MLIVRCPSSSAIKLAAIKTALAAVWPELEYDLRGLPVELQARDDLQIDAQPEGRERTVAYARERMFEMHRRYDDTPGLDISIESGAIDGRDVAVVFLRSATDGEEIVFSVGIPFPEGSLEEARRRGFKTTTAGDVIHERYQDVPANSWQVHFSPFVSREAQIAEAIENGLRRLSAD